MNKKLLFCLVAPWMLVSQGCGGDDKPAGSGGASATGGAKSTGGGTATGGAKSNGGGTAAGGTNANGGGTAIAGATSDGGTAGATAGETGGTSSQGGATSDGGLTSTGGESAAGGNVAQGGKSPAGGAGSLGGNTASGGHANGGSSNASGGTGGTGQGGMAQSGGSAGSGGQGTTLKAAAIAIGRLHSCAVTTTGAVRCWGTADHGQIGNGVTDGSSAGVFAAPVQVQGLTTGATAISSFSDHTCAVVSGGVKCWGPNDSGQLGNGSQTDSAVPVSVTGLSGVTAVAVGGDHSCALTSAGAVKCWGKNDFGQLGNDSTDPDSATPVNVSGLSSGVKAIAAGFGHTCAITSTDGMKCWGSNLYGELGIGAAGNGAHKPGDVSGLTSGVAAIGLGEYASCAATSAGALKCWGRNESGQLGNGESGTQVQEVAPVQVSGVTSGATAVSSGYGFTCAVISGAAKCWGSNFYYTLGNGESASFVAETPVSVTGLGSGITFVAATSSDHACALTSAGAIKCWGVSGGALGDGTTDDSKTPVAVVGFP